jgi:hypothetical protein
LMPADFYLRRMANDYVTSWEKCSL